MSFLQFDMPVGVKADLAELEYISSLHQVSKFPREDGAIGVKDIQSYLISRHGVKVSSETVEKVIMRGGLCGVATAYQNDYNEDSDNDDDDDKGLTMDLIELVGAIFIPQFAKYTIPEEERKDLTFTCPVMMNHVVKMMLHDVTGDSEPKELTVDLIRKILLKYGESVAASNETLIKEMYRLAGADDDDRLMLNEETLIRATTADLELYNIRNEVNVSTNWVDVFGDEEKSNWFDTSDQDVNVSHGHDLCLVKESEYGKKEDTFVDETSHAVKDEEQPSKFSIVNTLSPIDFTAGTYACKYQTMMTWASFIFSYIGYIYIPLENYKGSFNNCSYKVNLQWRENLDSFECSIAFSILGWLLTFVTVAAFGTLYVASSSIGNTVHSMSSVVPLFVGGAVVIAWNVLAPTFIGFYTDNYVLFYLRVLAAIVAFILVLLRILTILRHLLPQRFNEFTIKYGLVASAIKDETWLKKASALKITTMQRNACIFHDVSGEFEGSVVKSYFGRALASFAKAPVETKRVGGFLWSWKRILNQTSFYEDGIWFSVRIVASNLCAFLVTVMILLFGIYFTTYVYETYVPPNDLDNQVYQFLTRFFTAAADYEMVQTAANKIVNWALYYLFRVLLLLNDASLLKLDCLALGRYVSNICSNARSDEGQFACALFSTKPEELCLMFDRAFRPQETVVAGTEPSLPYLEIFNTTTLREPFAEVVSRAATDNVATQMNKFYPQERYMLVAPLILFTIVSYITSISIASIYGPSLMTTVLKMRSGVIPTLHDKTHFQYKLAVHNVALLSGSIFWGGLCASLLVGAIIGGLLFLCLWQSSAYIMQRIIAVLIAITLISVGKWLFLRTCRNSAYDGFYRTKPFAGNIFTLVNECWNFAITIALVWVRMFIFTVLGATFVGRVDRSFLGEDVDRIKYGEGIDFNLDNYNVFFLTDVFAAEAHRHPYIETLGAMYLMKLKYSRNFMTPAGSAWRLILVTVLMPWLQKYRNLAQGEGFADTRQSRQQNYERYDSGGLTDSADLVSAR